jgi:hypothetical protein
MRESGQVLGQQRHERDQEERPCRPVLGFDCDHLEVGFDQTPDGRRMIVDGFHEFVFNLLPDRFRNALLFV